MIRRFLVIACAGLSVFPAGDAGAQDASRTVREERFTINMGTARSINLYPPWSVLTEAVLLNEIRTDVTRRLSLASAAREVSAQNGDLAAEDRTVAVGAENVRIARSRLLPQAEFSALGTVIDRDRAAASAGSQAQRVFGGSASVSQLLFSEPAWADVCSDPAARSSGAGAACAVARRDP